MSLDGVGDGYVMCEATEPLLSGSPGPFAWLIGCGGAGVDAAAVVVVVSTGGRPADEVSGRAGSLDRGPVCRVVKVVVGFARPWTSSAESTRGAGAGAGVRARSLTGPWEIVELGKPWPGSSLPAEPLSSSILTSGTVTVATTTAARAKARRGTLTARAGGIRSDSEPSPQLPSSGLRGGREAGKQAGPLVRRVRPGRGG
jgi:hypothetical protein